VFLARAYPLARAPADRAAALAVAATAVIIAVQCFSDLGPFWPQFWVLRRSPSRPAASSPPPRARCDEPRRPRPRRGDRGARRRPLRRRRSRARRSAARDVGPRLRRPGAADPPGDLRHREPRGRAASRLGARGHRAALGREREQPVQLGARERLVHEQGLVLPERGLLRRPGSTTSRSSRRTARTASAPR
jgi:hypothetical protein